MTLTRKDDGAVPTVSVIIPARNEEACIGRCLESLVEQTGVPFEIIVVDDGSTDRTREIAEEFESSLVQPPMQVKDATPELLMSVRVIDAGTLPTGWSGKSNACVAGAKIALGKWLLFTDADTDHKPGSLARSVAEGAASGVDLLSYSPEQEVHGIAERALMPVVFAELAATYKPKEVSDRASAAAAANGQYLLITREAYDAVGGHVAVARDLLEDVALAKLVKQSGRKLRFRFGGDAVRTRMYRSWRQMCEGWTKNLALLFAAPAKLAALRGVEFVASVGAFTTALAAFGLGMNRIVIGAAIIAVPT